MSRLITDEVFTFGRVQVFWRESALLITD